jgi:imidazolonepropionase-like amidohydrolase
MIRFSAELKAKTIFYGGHEAYRSADLLKASGVPLLVSLKWPARDKDADPNEPVPIQELERWENAPSTPAALARAGVLFAFYSDGLEKPLDVVKAVKRAIDAGLPPEAALRAMTLSAAEMYGVADLLGSIDTGKIANLLVTRGNLFEDKTTIEHVFVDGVKFKPVAEGAAGEEQTSR